MLLRLRKNEGTSSPSISLPSHPSSVHLNHGGASHIKGTSSRIVPRVEFAIPPVPAAVPAAPREAKAIDKHPQHWPCTSPRL